ncbi:hypothetical protein K402DRAFT_338718 [Aulographum hederae CBS 113979]|uniref:CST complex subunit Ten1 n=1 Tax=Aulographum hederae CBS 113979 TaxID=1176131 RepID=A0A6G1GQK8_9PEZI|nr:hypothetical protein K402DRAFT_338718 [Aulographum hederae CBS 113979]
MARPPPSRLVFLADLQQANLGDKVRFLGCVQRYEIPTATLVLSHDYPREPAPKHAHVNIDHLLESVKSEDIQSGVWLNVVGYVSQHTPKSVHVQALMMWSAGSIKLDVYERALNERLATGT